MRDETPALLWPGDRPACVTCPTLWEGRLVVLEATANGSWFPSERGVQLPEGRGKAVVCLPWCVHMYALFSYFFPHSKLILQMKKMKDKISYPRSHHLK